MEMQGLRLARLHFAISALHNEPAPEFVTRPVQPHLDGTDRNPDARCNLFYAHAEEIVHSHDFLTIAAERFDRSGHIGVRTQFGFVGYPRFRNLVQILDIDFESPKPLFLPEMRYATTLQNRV